MLILPVTLKNWREALALFVALNDLNPAEAEFYAQFIEAMTRLVPAERMPVMANVNEL